jgi:predicted MFS family arabinose efflux permease
MTGFNHPALSRGQCFTILAGASVSLSIAMGMRQSFGLFLGPLTADLAISASEFTLAIAVQNILWGFVQPAVGALADKYGTRWIGVAGAILYAIGLSITAVADSFVLVLLGTGIVVGLALACSSTSLAAKIAVRAVRPERWSTALGIVSAAGSVGSFFAALLAQSVIQSSGWRIALFAFVGLSLAMLPGSFIAGRIDKVAYDKLAGPAQTALGALREAGGHRGYIVMTTAFFVCGLQLIFLTTHLPTFLATCGMDPILSAQALGMIGAFNILGSWVLGWAGDHYSRRTLLGTVYLIRSLFIAVYFMLPVSVFSTLLFAAGMGFLWLGIIPLVNGLVAQIFGVRYIATLTGAAFMSHQVGSFLGAWGGGVIYDSLGNYDLAWQIAVLIGVIAGTMQLFMDTKPTRRVIAERATAAA